MDINPNPDVVDSDAWFDNGRITYPDAARYCPNNNPIINFFGRRWWINYHWNIKTGTYQDEPFKSIFDPMIIQPTDGIQLRILPGQNQKVWRTSEIVLLDKLGYGDYLITARADSGSFSEIDKNAVFGVFLYQWSNAPAQNGRFNIHREIDFLEVLGGSSQAQFTLQPYDPAPHPVLFFKIPPNTPYITILNHWYHDNSAMEVKSFFYCFAGDLSFDQLPPPPYSNALARWSPHNLGFGGLIPQHTDTSSERLHINLWLMHGAAPAKEQSVTVTRFQYQPHQQ